MGYSEREDSVRVDFFRLREGKVGKWYTTEAVIWPSGLYSDCLTHEAFARALKAHLEGRLRDMVAICLEPYHEHACPISLHVSDIDRIISESDAREEARRRR